MIPAVIDRFVEEYEFLDNFYIDAPFIDYDGKEWPTTEHYFQAFKSLDDREREKIRMVCHPGVAKSMGRAVKLREDWETVKIDVMREALTYKFSQWNNLKYGLKKTDDAILIEGNYHHDNIWGDCYCKRCKNINGRNLLGKLLMEIREDL